MSEPSSSFVADEASNDPYSDRPDDFTGPPITAAEAERLGKFAAVCGEFATEAAEDFRAAEHAVRAAWASGASDRAATRALNEATKRFDLFLRAMRLTIDLKFKRVMKLEAWRKRQAAPATAAGARRAAAAQERGRTQQATAIVEETVAKGPAAASQSGQKSAGEFAEREFEKGLPNLPVDEVVALLCRDLGRMVSSQDWQGRPWAADAEAFFGREAAAEPETERETAEADSGPANPAPESPARSGEGAAPMPADGTAPEPQAGPLEPVQPVIPTRPAAQKPAPELVSRPAQGPPVPARSESRAERRKRRRRSGRKALRFRP